MLSIRGVEFADDLVLSVKLRTELLATLVCRHLTGISKQEYPNLRWPIGFLLELGAVFQICLWESEGLNNALSGLPSAADAYRNLFERVNTSPEAFGKLDSCCLLRRILTVWCERLIWLSPFQNGYEMETIGDDFDDETISRLVRLFM